MATSRREFLKKSTMVALATGVPLSLIHKVAGREMSVLPNAGSDLTKAAFGAQLNTQFRINDGGSQVLVKLVEVSNLRRGKAVRQDREGFSLVFRGSLSSALKQNTYLLEHETLGKFSFLLVPVMSKDKHAMYYESVVNCLYP